MKSSSLLFLGLMIVGGIGDVLAILSLYMLPYISSTYTPIDFVEVPIIAFLSVVALIGFIGLITNTLIEKKKNKQ